MIEKFGSIQPLESLSITLAQPSKKNLRLRKLRDEFPAPWIVPAVGLAGITRKFKNSYYFAMIT